MGYLNHVHNFSGIGNIKSVAEEDRRTRLLHVCVTSHRRTRWSGLLLHMENKISLHEKKKIFPSGLKEQTEYQGDKNQFGDS